MHQHVASLIPGLGTHLHCGFNPRLERIWEATDRCFSLTLMFDSLSLPLPLFLESIKTYYQVSKKKRERRGGDGIPGSTTVF